MNVKANLCYALKKNRTNAGESAIKKGGMRQAEEAETSDYTFRFSRVSASSGNGGRKGRTTKELHADKWP